MEIKQKRYIQRKKRVRAKIFGTPERPRLSVYKSGVHIYAQIIDDLAQKTLAFVSDLKVKNKNKTERASDVGTEIAKLAVAKKIKKVVFDRGAHFYHGRIKAVAEGARKGGLEF